MGDTGRNDTVREPFGRDRWFNAGSARIATDFGISTLPPWLAAGLGRVGRVGRPRPGYARLLEPAGRWRFAGDWLSYTPGWQHGAFESARRTVTALHEAALASE